MSNTRKYTPEVLNFLKDNYISQGAKFCADYLGPEFTEQSLHNACSRYGIKSRTTSVVNMNFCLQDFTNMSNPIIAYFLGLLWADGVVNFSFASLSNVIDDGKCFYETIKSVGRFVTYLHIPKNGIDKPQFIIKMGHTVIASYLMSMDYGIKSQTTPTKILSTIPDDLKNYFWLGVFDGDGNCYQHPRNRRQGKVCFAGSYEQDWSDLEQLLKSLGIRYKINKTINKKGQKSSTVTSFCLYEICKLENYFYKNYNNDGIGLKRKYDKFQLIKSNTGMKLKSKLGLTGVSKTVSGKFKMIIRINDEKFSGIFDNIESASTAYDIFLFESRGEYAKTNNPIEIYNEEFLNSEFAKSLKSKIKKAIPRS